MTPRPDPAAPDDKLLATLRAVTTATITTILLKHGIRATFLHGPRPARPAQPRVAGRAFTLRFIPAREDLATPAAWTSPVNTRAAIEAMPAGCIAVVDAMRTTTAGILGDILAARMAARGVAALVTDGALRDMDGVLSTALPIWCVAAASPPAIAALTLAGWNEPVACGGAAILPGDVIVADGDGAVVIPAALAEAVAAAAPAQEREEAWIMREVERGAPLPGLYPMDTATRARFERDST